MLKVTIKACGPRESDKCGSADAGLGLLLNCFRNSSLRVCPLLPTGTRSPGWSTASFANPSQIQRGQRLCQFRHLFAPRRPALVRPLPVVRDVPARGWLPDWNRSPDRPKRDAPRQELRSKRMREGSGPCEFSGAGKSMQLIYPGRRTASVKRPTPFLHKNLRHPEPWAWVSHRVESVLIDARLPL